MESLGSAHHNANRGLNKTPQLQQQYRLENHDRAVQQILILVSRQFPFQEIVPSGGYSSITATSTYANGASRWDAPYLPHCRSE